MNIERERIGIVIVKVESVESLIYRIIYKKWPKRYVCKYQRIFAICGFTHAGQEFYNQNTGDKNQHLPPEKPQYLTGILFWKAGFEKIRYIFESANKPYNTVVGCQNNKLASEIVK